MPEMRQIAPGGSVVGETGQNKHKQRLRGKESEYCRPSTVFSDA